MHRSLLIILLLVCGCGQPRVGGEYYWGWSADVLEDTGSRIPQEWRGSGQDKTALSYKSYEWLAGHSYIPRNQGTAPSCVGDSAAAAIDILAATQGKLVRTDASTLYGASRQEIGNYGPRARGGSHCVLGARAVNELGILFQEPYLIEDLSQPSPERCIEYGKYGVPDALESTAGLCRVREYYRVTNYADVRDAIYQGCTVVVGSNVGFGTRGQMVRDKDGFLNRPRWYRRPGYYWYHALAIIGVVDEGRKGVLVLNSWGENWISGPQRFGDEPQGSFWVSSEIVNQMASQGDCWALKNFECWTQ